MLIQHNLIIFLLFLMGCTTTTTSNRSILPGQCKLIKEIKKIKLNYLVPVDESTKNAISESIYENLLPRGYVVIDNNGSEEDAIVNINITEQIDSVASSSSGMVTGSSLVGNINGVGASTANSSSGKYISGINIRLTKKDTVLGIASVTQVREKDFIPRPPQILGRDIGNQLLKILSCVVYSSSTQ